MDMDAEGEAEAAEDRKDGYGEKNEYVVLQFHFVIVYPVEIEQQRLRNLK
jgi:hypothetical protein